MTSSVAPQNASNMFSKATLESSKDTEDKNYKHDK